MDDLLIFGGLIMFLVGVVMLVKAFVKKTKKKQALLLIAIGFIVWVVGGAFVETDDYKGEPISETDISTVKEFKSSKDISVIMGLTIEGAHNKTGLNFESMGTELLQPEIEKFKSGNDNIIVYTDTETHTIYEIVLFGSDYNLFGVTNRMNEEEQNTVLIKNGFTEIAESVYRYKDTYDGIETYPNLKYKTNYLQELALKADTERAYEKTSQTAVGAVYIGNGQMIEYSSTSLPYLAYELDNETEINKGKIIEKYNDTYVQISGKITEVFEDGTIRILSQDEEATDMLGKLWPLQAYSDIMIVPEESFVLQSLKKDAEVVFYAKVDMYSYQNIVGMQCFECYDGILYYYSGELIPAPEINSVAGGILKPLKPQNTENNKTVDKSEEISNLVKSKEEAIAEVKAYYKKQKAISDPENNYDEYTTFTADDCEGYYKVYATFGGNFEVAHSIYIIDKEDKNNIEQIY